MAQQGTVGSGLEQPPMSSLRIICHVGVTMLNCPPPYMSYLLHKNTLRLLTFGCQFFPPLGQEHRFVRGFEFSCFLDGCGPCLIPAWGQLGRTGGQSNPKPNPYRPSEPPIDFLRAGMGSCGPIANGLIANWGHKTHKTNLAMR